jgi:hypothetical protein
MIFIPYPFLKRFNLKPAPTQIYNFQRGLGEGVEFLDTGDFWRILVISEFG